MDNVPICKSCSDFPSIGVAFPRTTDGNDSQNEWPVCNSCFMMALIAGWKPITYKEIEKKKRQDFADSIPEIIYVEDVQKQTGGEV